MEPSVPRPRDDRPTAEEMLERIRREAGSGARGRLRIYLGMAPGVGKTYAALMELQRRRARGTDCVVGYVETYGRPKTIEALDALEVIPRRQCQYKGVTVEEMDLEAILRRRPAVVLIDELAHSNVPGCSRHEKRWQDVLEILDHGITVITTLNIQHLESLADIVESITGVPVRERVPDWVVTQADEVELVDMTPHALRQRIRHGNVYPPERAERALQEFFREGNLAALRELALRTMATRVEQDLEQYMRQHGIEAVWPAGERVMVAIDDDPRSQYLIRRAWRRAQRQQSDLLAVFVETPAWAHASPEAKQRLEEHFRLAEDLGTECIRIRGDDVATALAQVAHEKNVDSIVIGHSRRSRLHELLQGSIVNKLLRLAGDVDVHVVAERRVRSNGG
ncbi:MAG: universal stress protein [Chloroflexi bacterium]|nr:universal stress protein [Chloroflexota bacterium]